jgi:hypothetical protein
MSRKSKGLWCIAKSPRWAKPAADAFSSSRDEILVVDRGFGMNGMPQPRQTKFSFETAVTKSPVARS